MTWSPLCWSERLGLALFGVDKSVRKLYKLSLSSWLGIGKVRLNKKRVKEEWDYRCGEFLHNYSFHPNSTIFPFRHFVPCHPYSIILWLHNSVVSNIIQKITIMDSFVADSERKLEVTFEASSIYLLCSSVEMRNVLYLEFHNHGSCCKSD